MAELSSEDYNTRNIYLFWSFEKMAVRYNFKTKEFFIKSIDHEKDRKVPFHNKAVTDVRLHGSEITKEEYETGIVKSTQA